MEIGKKQHLGEVLFPTSCQGATPLHFLIALADLERGGRVLIVAFSTDKNTPPPPFPFERAGESGVEIGGGGGARCISCILLQESPPPPSGTLSTRRLLFAGSVNPILSHGEFQFWGFHFFGVPFFGGSILSWCHFFQGPAVQRSSTAPEELLDRFEASASAEELRRPLQVTFANEAAGGGAPGRRCGRALPVLHGLGEVPSL